MDTRVKPYLASAPARAFDLPSWSAARLESVERALERWVTGDPTEGLDHGAPAELVQAMRYAAVSYTHLTLPTNREV